MSDTKYRQRPRRRLTAMTLSMVAVLTTSACGGDGSTGAPTRASYASAPCPNPIYPGTPDLGPEFDCGYLTVPENRSNPTARLSAWR